MKHSFILCSVLVIAFNCLSPLQAVQDSQTPVEQRIYDLISKMTLEEKIDMIGGTGFETKPNARLGIPEFKNDRRTGPGSMGNIYRISCRCYACIDVGHIARGAVRLAISQEMKAKDRMLFLVRVLISIVFRRAEEILKITAKTRFYISHCRFVCPRSPKRKCYRHSKTLCDKQSRVGAR